MYNELSTWTKSAFPNRSSLGTRTGKSARHYCVAAFKYRCSSRDCASLALTSLRPRPRNSASQACSARETIRDRSRPSNPPVFRNVSLKKMCILYIIVKKTKKYIFIKLHFQKHNNLNEEKWHFINYLFKWHFISFLRLGFILKSYYLFHLWQLISLSSDYRKK